MYMMWQLASLPFCCCSREKCTVNTHLSTGISIPLIKAFNTPSHRPTPKKKNCLKMGEICCKEARNRFDQLLNISN